MHRDLLCVSFVFVAGSSTRPAEKKSMIFSQFLAFFSDKSALN
jgi:hypothetical protein